MGHDERLHLAERRHNPRLERSHKSGRVEARRLRVGAREGAAPGLHQVVVELLRRVALIGQRLRQRQVALQHREQLRRAGESSAPELAEEGGRIGQLRQPVGAVALSLHKERRHPVPGRTGKGGHKGVAAGLIHGVSDKFNAFSAIVGLRRLDQHRIEVVFRYRAAGAQHRHIDGHVGLRRDRRELNGHHGLLGGVGELYGLQITDGGIFLQFERHKVGLVAHEGVGLHGGDGGRGQVVVVGAEPVEEHLGVGGPEDGEVVGAGLSLLNDLYASTGVGLDVGAAGVLLGGVRASELVVPAVAAAGAVVGRVEVGFAPVVLRKVAEDGVGGDADLGERGGWNNPSKFSGFSLILHLDEGLYGGAIGHKDDVLARLVHGDVLAEEAAAGLRGCGREEGRGEREERGREACDRLHGFRPILGVSPPTRSLGWRQRF